MSSPVLINHIRARTYTILRYQVVDSCDQLLLYVWLILRFVEVLAAIDVILQNGRVFNNRCAAYLSNECDDKPAALVLLFEEAVLYVFRHMKLGRTVGAVG